MAKQIKCATCSVYPNVVYHAVGDGCPRMVRALERAAEEVPVAEAEVVFTPAITPAPSGLESVIVEAIKPHLTSLIDREKVADIARTEARNVAPVRVEVARIDEPPKDMGVQHKRFPELLKMLVAGLNVWLVGPAGTGKTLAAETTCEALGYRYFRAKSVGPTTAEYDLLGYNTADGTFKAGAFYEAYKHGGVLLIDEIDSASGDALIAINAALANGFAFFGDERVNKHADFRCIAAANTVGQGRDSVYIGRSQLDGATLDRFSFLRWGYDEGIERSITSSWAAQATTEQQMRIDRWYALVMDVRRITEEMDIRIPISTRAIIDGCRYIVSADASLKACADMRLWERMSSTDAKKVQSNLTVPAK